MSHIVGTPLDDRSRALLARETERAAASDPAWIEAWHAALRGTAPGQASIVRQAHDLVWIPRLEGRAGATAIWGATLAVLLDGMIDPCHQESLRGPWERFGDIQRNVFGDSAI